MEWIHLALTILCMTVIQITGVHAYNPDVAGMAGAGCASFVMLCVVVTMIGFSCCWESFVKNWMKQKGKVKMPRAYFQRKKEEAKKRLIPESVTSQTSEANGKLPAQSVDREGQKAQWVQGWSQKARNFSNHTYEEKDVTMELGDEVDDGFVIETEVVDNEVLDVGPYKSDHSIEFPVKGDVYPETYIYSTADRSKPNSTNIPSKPLKAGNSKSHQPQEMTEDEFGYSKAIVTNFNDQFIQL